MSTLESESDARALFHLKYGRRDGFTLPGAEKHYPPDLELEPSHLDIDAYVDVAAGSLDGTVTVSIAARRAGPTRLALHAVAFEALDVRDVGGGALTWTYDGRELAIEWATPFAAAEARRVAVRYRVQMPASGLYFSRPTDAYPDAPWLAVTDHETERARHWLPCVDLPNARPRLDFHLRAESRFTILANGALVEEVDHGDGTKTAHWRLDFPCPSYLTAFAIGDFVRADDGDVDGVPVAYFAPAGFSVDDLRRSFGRTGEMLRWMAGKLDLPLPFPKYYQVAATGAGGAMENISLVMWDDVFVMDATLAEEWTRLLDEINLHEMAHSYFGDAVVCRDYAHAWLKESWATYMEQVWFKDRHGDDEHRYQYYCDAHAYFTEADGRYMRPIVTREFNSSWDMYDAHLYPGGACRLHTLCQELGEETFWAAVRDYVKRFAGEVVETDDFRHVLESHSGRALGRLFDQWFHTAGYPAIKVTFKYDPKRQEGTFDVVQTQVKEAGKEPGKDGAAPAVPPFQLSTDVGWVMDGEAFTYPVKVTEARHSVVVRMTKDPEQVRFDPLAKVLHKLDFNPGDDKLRRQLVAAPDVIGRILAGRELVQTGTRANVRAVADAWRVEPFYGVRAQWARALGEAGVEPALEALVELVAWEQDPMVVAPVMRAAGQYRDDRIRAALEARLDAGLTWYHARAAALEALGNQRDQAPFERLAKAAAEDGFGGHVQSGAFRALAASRREEAIPLLTAATAYGATSNRARPMAVMALGGMGRLQDKAPRARIVEALVDLLRDPLHRVRGAAVTGLQMMGATEASGALEAYRRPLSVQEQVRVDRALQAIRAAAKPKPIESEKLMDELRETVRKLRDRVDALEAKAKEPGDGKSGGTKGVVATGAGDDGAAGGDRAGAPSDRRKKDKGKKKRGKDDDGS